MLLALMVLSAGAEGFPFAEDLEDVFDALGQRMGYATNSKLWLQRQLHAALEDYLGMPRDTAMMVAEMMRRGVLANTSFASLGARVGMGNLIPGSSVFQVGKDIGGEIVEAAGVAASFARNVGQAAELVARGEFARAGEKALPSGAANVLKGVRQLGSGTEVSPFGKKIADVPTQQGALQTLGVSPANVNRAREREQVLKQNEAFLKVVEDRIADKWARGIAEHDPAVQQEAREDLRAHNEKNPDNKIRISPQQVHSRVKNLMRDPESSMLRSVAKERRVSARDYLREGT
jgi:hypothetical protein